MSTLDLNRIADLVRSQGIDALVERTGGNVATLFAGPTRTGRDGETRYSACAGSGWFTVDGNAYADTAEFYVGPDAAPDDALPLELDELDELDEITTEEQIAALIVAQTQLPDPTMTLRWADAARVLGSEPPAVSRAIVTVAPMCSGGCPGDYLERTGGRHLPGCDQYVHPDVPDNANPQHRCARPATPPASSSRS